MRTAEMDSEKLTINLGFVDLGHIDLLVREGFYSNRSDFIRTAVRHRIDGHRDAIRIASERSRLDVGIRRYARAELEALRIAGQKLDIQVLGLAIITPDVTPDLALATIASIQVLGALHAPAAVKAALRLRTRR